MNYDEGINAVAYHFPAVPIDTAAVFGRIAGPAGKTGRLIGIGTVITTATTVAAAELRVGTIADPDAYGTQAVAILSADALVNAFTDLTSDANLITADTVVELSSDGGATAGAGDVVIYINWF